MNFTEFKSFSKLLADESGKVIKSHFRKPIITDTKQDDSPVTIADKKAEDVMRELISKEFPNHGIIGEEFGVTNENAEYKWVLDTIDGTKSFICGTITFGTLIALMKNNKPVYGVINQPILNEFLIGNNEKTELNGKDVKVRKCSSLKDAVLLTTDHLSIEKHHKRTGFEQLVKGVKLYRNWGDCYGYYLLATGFADIMIDPIMSDWDKMALIPVINGAGGVITDYYGKDPLEGESIVSASPHIHKEVISILSS